MSAWRREAVGREPPPHRIGRVEPADEAERPVAPVEPGEEPGAAEADSVGLVAVVAMARTEAQPSVVDQPEEQRHEVKMGRDLGPGRAAVLERDRSEEHTSELQSLMRTSYAGLCLDKKNRIYKT